MDYCDSIDYSNSLPFEERGIFMRRFISLIIFITTVLTLYGCPASEFIERRKLEKAKQELAEYCGSFPTSMYGLGMGREPYEIDITGDGLDDLCTSVFFGSGMPRTDTVVYDYHSGEFYVIDGWPKSYGIEGIEDGRLIVHEYDTATSPMVCEDGRWRFTGGTWGTVQIVDGDLVFVPDA